MLEIDIFKVLVAGSVACAVPFLRLCFRRRAKVSLQSLFKHDEEPVELTCSICFMMFRDPVVTAHGFTYERQAILEFWNSAACSDGPRDPQSGNLPVERQLAPNWEVRRLVGRFLADNPGYIPQGWPDRMQPAPAVGAGEVLTPKDLPGGLQVGDAVVTLVGCRCEGRYDIRKGEVGRTLGRGAAGSLEHVRCSFPDAADVELPLSSITKRNLPGSYRVGDIVVSLIDHSSGPCNRLLKGDIGRVVAQATVDSASRLKVDFPQMMGLDIFPSQISPQELPGGHSVGEEVVSLIDHASGDAAVFKGERGTVAGRATTDAKSRVKVDFPNMRGLDIYPCQVCPVMLPGGYALGAKVVSLIHFSTSGLQLRKGDLGEVVGRADVDHKTRVKVDFPSMKGLDICADQLRPVAGVAGDPELG